MNCNCKLLHIVEAWLHEEKERQRQKEAQDPQAKSNRAGAVAVKNTVMPSKHMAFFR